MTDLSRLVTSPTLRRVGLVLITVAASLALGRGAFTAGPRPAPTDPLLALNQQFHDAYRRARLEKLTEAGPVVVVNFAHLTLHRGQDRVEIPFPPPAFHKLKEVAHVPLLTFVMLDGTEGKPIDPVKRAEVGYVLDLVNASLDSIEGAGFDLTQLDRQKSILAISRDYLSAVLQDGRAPSERLNDFAARTGPLLLANADDAALIHLRALNDQMDAWRSELGPDGWRSLRVVVMSAHMARDQEISMQYFTKLLGETAEGRRLVFAEGVADESKALDLLGTHLLDGSAARAFFGDPMRLHRDLLSDGATKALRSLTIRP